MQIIGFLLLIFGLFNLDDSGLSLDAVSQCFFGVVLLMFSKLKILIVRRR